MVPGLTNDLILPNGAEVRKAMFDAKGISETMSSDSLLIDTSTIDPLETDEIRSDLMANGIAMVDVTGLDRDLAIKVMSGTAAGTDIMNTNYQKKVLQGDLSLAFMIDLAKKDLDIALKLSKQLKAPLSLAEQAETIYSDAQKAGRSGQDWTAIYDMLLENRKVKA